MRKGILMMLLAVVSSSAAAEWVEYRPNPLVAGVGSRYKNPTIYIDPSTVRKNGDKVKLWILLDYDALLVLYPSNPYNRGQYKSLRGQIEFDCKEEHSQDLYASFHYGNMGSGVAVDSFSSPHQSVLIPLDSTNAILWKYACGKK